MDGEGVWVWGEGVVRCGCGVLKIGEESRVCGGGKVWVEGWRW